MTTHFSCTMCGKCCHNLRLPLSVEESVSWLKRGGAVEIFADAVPWPVEPSPDDGPAQHKRRRSFAANSGEQPIRVALTFVASFDGPCPHLLPDMRCGAYEERPRVCRIYPAEVNPYVKLVPASKACPPEAWSINQPVFEKDGNVLDTTTIQLIHQSRDADARDALVKQRVALLLGYDTAALSNEGFAIYSPAPEVAIRALEAAISMSHDELANQPLPRWTFVSNQTRTLDSLQAIGSNRRRAGEFGDNVFTFLGFYADDVPV